MRITFLGGASEIGASAALVEIGGLRVLVDAGVRQGQAERGPLPGMEPLEAGVDAVLLTHAHLDHSGALPLVHREFPHAPVIATAPTRDILSILLHDAVKVMGARQEREEELPLYEARDVAALVEHVTPQPYRQPLALGAEVEAVFFPAGHILGAACVGIESRAEGRVLFSGDFSIGAQRTVPGMPLPDFRPDVLVTESTYGDRLHADRLQQEERLVAQVADTLEEGGKVLIPAFALGRAQEVILVLRRAITKKELRPFPIFIDGMVRGVCGVYGSYPYHLNAAARKRASKGTLFLGGTVAAVSNPEEREKIVAGPPCCVVASSGMLAGGASAFYAARLAGGEGNLIAITGYQDEESPGRRLLELAESSARRLVLEGREVEVRCRVETYHLSAHADRNEIVALAARLKPREVVLVHGAAQARGALAREVARALRCRTYLPDTGDTLAFAGEVRRCAAPRPGAEPLGAGEELSLEGLEKVHEALVRDGARREIDLAELLRLWHGARDFTEEEWRQAYELVEESGLFRADRRRPFAFRPIPLEERAVRAAREEGPLDQDAALARVDALLPRESGLYQRGAQAESKVIVLRFFFPVQAERCRDVLARIEEETGWTVRVHPYPHAGALADELQRILGAEVHLAREPSIRLEEGEVIAWVTREPDGAEELEEAFRAATGLRLAVRRVAETPRAKELRDAEGRMEINEAYRRIDECFASLEDRPYRRGRKTGPEGPHIEVTFLTPAVGMRQRALLDRLE
ncbi:MAG: MBL fold metallo-hydrolase, partial [Planctomycetes bacterium]|nr:MBL fold metallo-hydrolase [Planctomycetota bacterium]